MSSHGSHIGWHPAKPNTILKGTSQGTFLQVLVKIGIAVSGVDENENPHRLNVKLSPVMAAMFDDARKN